MLSVLVWWFLLQVIGVLTLPLVLKLFRFLPDRGFGFARQAGLLLTGYLFWILVTLGILQNTAASIVLVLLLVGGASALLWAREGREMLAFLRQRGRLIVATEVLFFVSFVSFAVFRAYNPEIAATEKPMEFGFINAILRSRTFPPRDPWLSGYSISYYYFGYVIVAMLTRLSGLASDITFNLAGITLFALTVNGAFSLVYNLVQAYLERRAQLAQGVEKVVSWASILTGLFGSLLVALMGNLEGVFELIRARGGGSEALWRWLDVKDLRATPPSSTWYPDDGWWWWRASRVIHDRNAAGQSIEVIDEFPFFSFLLGDNHPHVLALPFVLLALALALNLLLSLGKPERSLPAEPKGDNLLAKLFRAIQAMWAGGPFDLLLWALLLGGLGFLNTWDYPIYLGLFVLVYAICRQAEYKRLGWEQTNFDPPQSRRGSELVWWLTDVVQMGVVMAVLGLLFYLPFYLGFRSQAGGVGLVGAIKTRWHQYLLMLGVSIYLLISLLVALLVKYARSSPEERRLPPLALFLGAALLLFFVFALAKGWWTAAGISAFLSLAAALFVWGGRLEVQDERPSTRLEASSLFALLLAIAGLALTVSVEFIYLKDTFDNRMNTVFKFYYQAWVLTGIAAAYGTFYVAQRFKASGGLARAGLVLWGFIAIVLVYTGLSYTVAATISKANGFKGQPTLDGTRYVKQYRQDDYEAIQWLRAHAPLDAVMVEAPGGSYSEYNWVSAHTGIPTLLGWGGHELQWRGNYNEPGKREPEIEAIYRETDVAKVSALLDKYGIDYVYVGRLEQEKYHLSQPMIRKFERIMIRAYENGSVTIFARSR